MKVLFEAEGVGKTLNPLGKTGKLSEVLKGALVMSQMSQQKSR